GGHLLVLSGVSRIPKCEDEGPVREVRILAAVGEMVSQPLELEDGHRAAGTRPEQSEAGAKRKSVGLSEGWRGLLAARIVTKWSETPPEKFPQDLLLRAEKLVHEINQRIAKRSAGSSDMKV